MEIIHLSKSDLESLRTIPIENPEGIEGTIYIYKDIYVIKIFKDIDPKTLENKKRKIQLLNKSADENVAKPEKLVYVDGNFAGYSMKYYANAKTLYDLSFCTRRRKLISILKKIKNIVLNLRKKNIHIIDYNPKNFLLVGNKIVLCDSDNWYVEGFKPDVLNVNTNRLINNGFKLDETMESYNFNIMTISVLTRILRPYVLKHIRNNNIFLNKQARKIVKNMAVLNPQETRYIVDCFKDKEKRLKLF